MKTFLDAGSEEHGTVALTDESATTLDSTLMPLHSETSAIQNERAVSSASAVDHANITFQSSLSSDGNPEETQRDVHVLNPFQEYTNICESNKYNGSSQECSISRVKVSSGPTKDNTSVMDKEKEEVSEIKVVDNLDNIVLPDYLQLLMIGAHIDGDTRVSMDSRPDWLDVEKFHRGQKFALDHLFGLVYAEMLSLIMLFSFNFNLKPLIYTGKSDTPFKAFKRYLSTVVRLKSWYEGDPWREGDEARKNFKTVRAMHDSVRYRLNKPDSSDRAKRITLGSTPTWSTLVDKLQEDFRSSCPSPLSGQCPYLNQNSTLYINQAEMAVTQFGFVGLMILYPSSFGAGGASEEDLDAFVHVWRVFGFLLGIDDCFNLCSGDLETVKQRSKDIIDIWIKPNLRDVNREWEHMLRCVVEGISYYVPGVTFEVSLLYLCRLLGIRSPRLESALTWVQWFMYRLISLVMCYMLRIPGYRRFSNWLLNSSIKKTLSASPKWIREHEERAYEYQQQNGGLCTRL